MSEGSRYQDETIIAATQRRDVLLPGTILGDYEILAVLGQGGFGITYRGRHIALDRPVAIKEFFIKGYSRREPDGTVAATGPLDSDEFSLDLRRKLFDRFLSEARKIATKFSHPGVVRGDNFFAIKGSAYLVMELIDGQSFEDWLADFERLGRQPTEAEIRPILDRVLNAIEYIHAQGEIHRDLKPQNIMLRRDQSPVLIDFGASRTGLGRGNNTSIVLATDGYAPPEQLTDDGLSQLGCYTDIYSIGAVFYRVIAGTRPHDAFKRLTARHRRGDGVDPYRPAREAAKEASHYSPAFLAAIDRALELDERDRPQTIAEFRTALRWDATAPNLAEAPNPRAGSVVLPVDVPASLPLTRSGTRLVDSRKSAPSVVVETSPRPSSPALWLSIVVVALLVVAGLGFSAFVFRDNLPPAISALFGPPALPEDAATQQAREAKRLEERARAEAQQRADAEAKAEAERIRLANEAKAAAEAKQRADAEARAEAERIRLANEAKAAAEAQQRAEAEAKAEAERIRLANEAKAAADAQQRADAEAKAEAERIRLANEAKAAAEAKQRAEAQAKAEAERIRLANEAKAATEAKQRAEALAKAEAERVRLANEAKAAAEAKQRAEAEAKAEAERIRLANEAKAAAEAKQRADAEAKAEAERIRLANEAKAAAEAKQRAEAQAKAEAERVRLTNEAKARADAEAKQRAEAQAKADAERIRLANEAKAAAEAKQRADAEARRLADEAEAKQRADAAQKATATRPAIVRDCADCPELVSLPAGSFTMGAGPDDSERAANEGPPHLESVNPFLIGRTPVTFADWDACVAAKGCQLRPDDAKWGRDKRPVINVSYDETAQYLDWLSKKTGKRYRLPTEAEWEYAARAGSTTTRPWGTNPDEACRFANIYDSTAAKGVNFKWMAHNCSDAFVFTAPVASFEPNAFGLYDMLGNVWQWTADCWREDYRTPATSAADCDQRALRGGSWMSDPANARAPARQRNDAADKDINIGFRIARDLP